MIVGSQRRAARLALTGLAATLDEAMATLNERWSQWLSSAELTETP
jgi:hypothetical protein